MTNKSEIMVSVCMITYNHEKYIREAIEGVLMQKTNFSIELIIGEDCSTDDTRAICLEYQKKYPDVIHLQLPEKNKGMITNFFENMQAARGKYIALCEGDDYWTDPYKLQKQVDFLEANEDYSFSHTPSTYLYSESRTFKESKEEDEVIRELQNKSLDDIRENILDHNNYRIQTASVVFRRELYNKVVDSDIFLYKSGYFMMGDTQLWIGLLSFGKLHFLETSTAVYRIHNNSACRPPSIEREIRFRLSSCEMRAYLLSKNKYSKKMNYKIKKRYYITLWKYLIFNPEFSPRIKFWPVFIISYLMKNSLFRYLSKLIFENKYHIKITN